MPRAGTLARRCLDLLLERDWVCGADLAASIGWAFGSRISDLRSRGFTIERRECMNPQHFHKTRVFEYGGISDG